MVEKMADDRLYMIISQSSCSKDSVDDYTGLAQGELYSLAVSRIRDLRSSGHRDCLGMRDDHQRMIFWDGGFLPLGYGLLVFTCLTSFLLTNISLVLNLTFSYCTCGLVSRMGTLHRFFRLLNVFVVQPVLFILPCIGPRMESLILSTPRLVWEVLISPHRLV